MTVADIEIRRAESIYGLMDAPDLWWLGEQAKKSLVIAEVGSYHGRSTRVLADNTPGTVYAVDDWRWQGGDRRNPYLEFRRNLADHLATAKVVETITDHRNVDFNLLPLWFDMVFLDGDHDYVAVKRDIEQWMPHLYSGGILCGHDYSQRFWGVIQAVQEKLPGAKQVTQTELPLWAWTKP